TGCDVPPADWNRPTPLCVYPHCPGDWCYLLPLFQSRFPHVAERADPHHIAHRHLESVSILVGSASNGSLDVLRTLHLGECLWGHYRLAVLVAGELRFQPSGGKAALRLDWGRRRPGRNLRRILHEIWGTLVWHGKPAALVHGVHGAHYPHSRASVS